MTGIKKRETNYDLLRIICCLSVIMFHSNNFFYFFASDPTTRIIETALINQTDPLHVFLIFLFNDGLAFAVPCFMMISGAFLLSNDKNVNYKLFFRKMIITILIPTLTVSALYILFALGTHFLGAVVLKKGIKHFVDSIISYLGLVLRGEPATHLWYMYTLIAMYPFVPLVIKFKNSIGEDAFKKISIIYIFVALVSGWSSNLVLIHWSIAKVSFYFGYFLLGYQIRLHSEKNNRRGLLYILSGIIIIFFMILFRSWLFLRKGYYIENPQTTSFSIVNTFSPYVVLISFLLFKGFSVIKVNEKESLTNVAIDTFTIYLLHGFVRNIVDRIYYSKSFYCYDSVIVTIFIFFFTVIISYILAKIYKKIWVFFNEKLKIEEHILKLFRLN